VAVLLALPVGMLLAWFNQSILPTWSADTEAMIQLIEIYTPLLTVAPTASAASSQWSWWDPTFLSGMGILALLTLGSVALMLTLYQIGTLYRNTGDLIEQPIHQWTDLSDHNQQLCERQNVHLSFSALTDIPYTFGWSKPHIVIPESLQDHSQKANLVIRHELMHIQQRDYPINTLLLIIRGIFVLHPLVHAIHRSVTYWREVSCDAGVLADQNVSTRTYAQLLFELATNQHAHRQPVVTMAAQTSTLKQRLTDMKKLTTGSPMNLKRSIQLLFVGIFMISGIMACSDIQEGGITAAELEETRTQLDDQQHQGHKHTVTPLVNGEPVEGGLAVVTRIKEGYIQKVNVYSPEQAKQKLGIDSDKKVMNLQVEDRELALSDLYTEQEIREKKEMAKKNPKLSASEDIFVVVDKMPELKGGIKSIMENVRYPDLARKAGIEGRVFVQFVVDENGNVINPEVVRGIGAGCDEAALEAVKKAKFEPGFQNGRPVKVKYAIPISFKLPEDGQNKS
jgi:TonB family protein